MLKIIIWTVILQLHPKHYKYGVHIKKDNYVQSKVFQIRLFNAHISVKTKDAKMQIILFIPLSLKVVIKRRNYKMQYKEIAMLGVLMMEK